MNDQRPAARGESESDTEPLRRYIGALGALDTAAAPASTVGSGATTAANDVARLNAIWNEGGPGHDDQSFGARIKRFFLELKRMTPWHQRRVNGAMIAAINRNAETTRALIDATENFQAHVVWYAQSVAGIASVRRGNAATAEGVEAIQRALQTLTNDWLAHWESLAAREQRYDARMTSLTKAYDGVLEVATLAQQSTLALKRAVEAIPVRALPDGGPTGGATPASTQTPAAPAPASGPDPNAFKYLAFEDRYRGSRDEIQRRLAEYVPLFEGASNVLDVGCGRGELLGLLRDRDISARGIDINDEIVETCRTRGLTADRVDALTFLAGQPDASIGGLIAIQVVEHLEANYLMRLVDLAYQKLKPGAPLVLETINTACWAAFFDSYIRDFTHVHPLHPDTLRYLVQASGFASADIRYLAPIAEHDKLPLVRIVNAGDATPTVLELVESLNAHANRLNSQLFTYRDYAIIARR